MNSSALSGDRPQRTLRPDGAPGSPSRPADRPGAPREAQERFRATARRIARQLDIEERMWQMLGRGRGTAEHPGMTL